MKAIGTVAEEEDLVPAMHVDFTGALRRSAGGYLSMCEVEYQVKRWEMEGQGLPEKVRDEKVSDGYVMGCWKGLARCCREVRRSLVCLVLSWVIDG